MSQISIFDEIAVNLHLGVWCNFELPGLFEVEGI